MKRLAVLVSVLVLLSCGTAFAEGFALYEYSARGVALGGATVARKPDPSVVATNPALITRLKGAQVQAGFSAITPSGKMETWDDAGDKDTTKLKKNTWLVPNAYYTQQINDNWYFGIGEFSRFGLGFEYPHNWPGRFNVYQVDLQSASINPNIAWAATDKLSLAVGLELVYVSLDLNKRFTGGLGSYYFEGDSDISDAHDVAPGFNVAGHYQFSDQWAAGLSYRSQVRVHARGNVEFSYVGDNAATAGPGESIVRGLLKNGYAQNTNNGQADAVVILPDSVAGGVAWTPIPELSIEAGAIWTRWSTFRSLNIHLPSPMEDSKNRKNWKDTWRLNVGVEWQVLDWLALRAGYVYDQSPMTDKYADYLVPTDGRNIYSLGVGFKYNSWTLDLAYAYIDAKGRNYSQDDYTHVVKSKSVATSTNIVSVSLGYEF